MMDQASGCDLLESVDVPGDVLRCGSYEVN